MAKRLTPNLRRTVLDLPMQDRLALMEALRVSIQVPGADREARLAFLADKMREVSGVDIRASRDRSTRAVWPRYIFCFVARREGYFQSSIGEVVGRDHSTICYAERRVTDAFSLPEVYAQEIELYNKYIEAL